MFKKHPVKAPPKPIASQRDVITNQPVEVVDPIVFTSADDAIRLREERERQKQEEKAIFDSRLRDGLLPFYDRKGEIPLIRAEHAIGQKLIAKIKLTPFENDRVLANWATEYDQLGNNVQVIETGLREIDKI